MTNFEWYRSFVAVYRLGTVTAASKVLFITQAGASQHIAALESKVGGALFVRAGRRMVPTERGKALYSQVAEALDRLESVERRFQARGEAPLPLVRIGSPYEYFHEQLLPRLVRLPVRIWARFGLAADLLSGLGKGELDVVISTQPAES